MKYPFNISVKACLLASLLFGFALPGLINAAATGPLNLATQPLANSTTLFVKPNLMFIFDDSTSMDRDFIPDLAGDAPYDTLDYYFKNADFNGMAYDPAVTYSPPGYFTSAGAVDTTTYPSQTGTSTATGQSSTPTPNWKGVRANAYVSGGTTNIESGAYFYTAIAGEYCKELDYKECIAATAESATYPFPAPLRWCRTDAIAKQLATPTEATAGVASSATAPSCQAANDTNHNFPRFPSPRQTTITVAAGTGVTTVVNSIRPGGASGPQILSAATVTSNTTSIVASRIRDNINACTSVVTGSCTVAGYAAIVDPGNSSRVIIVAPTNTAIAAPAMTKTPAASGLTLATAAFTTAISGSNVPGRNLLTVISTGNVYSYPGSSTASPDRIDCTGTCTYAKEMENYANWYTYYRVRLQAMQTSVSRAFRTVDNRFRIGFSTINDTTVADGTEFLVPKTFETANKKGWYDKLFSIDNTNLFAGTPNRFALAKIGNFYAKKVSGQTFDPIQYSCQQNFAILSTDGFWNKNGPESGAFTPRKPDGTAIGDQDSGTSVPLKYRQGPAAASNSLADVAKFFAETDLRTPALNNCSSGSGTGETLCSTPAVATAPDPYNNVFKGGEDVNEAQHMTTFTMAFGLQDKLTYEPNYDNAVKGDFYRLKTGTAPTTQWTNPDIANTGITVPGRVDDLWHAAVSGRGKYFSAAKPEEVVSGFVDLLTSITTTLGAGAAAATSTLNPVAGDDFAYVASYTTGEWAGNLEARKINLTTGAVDATVIPANGGWCVESVGLCTGKLGAQAEDPSPTARKIWTKGTNAGSLNNFKFGTGGDLNTADFNSTKLSGLSQWASLGGTKQTAAVASIVDYLRGKKDKEFNVTDSDDRLFRVRQATLGDAINSQPAFIGKSTFSYTDTDYNTFKATTLTRAKTVYMGTNDGMMHAFNASASATEQGKERWAYVPSMVIPNMWKLADNNYSANHAYFADGSPIISDVYYDGSWKTILVAGLNGGGKGYYALNITDPDAPTLLWEFTPADDAAGQDLGFTYGKPVITKRSDGRWVVLVTSGYNNTTGTNKGKGFLYVLDAKPDSGGKVQILKKIATGAGTAAIPSGLAQISAYADDPEKNNTATFVYGGDLLGNLWRFDIRDGFESAYKFASLSGQPITTKPELGTVLSNFGTTHRVVFVGTGMYLETNDLTDNSIQTLYAIKDDDVLGSGSITPELVNPRGTATAPPITTGTVAGEDRMVVQTLSTASSTSRTVTSNNPVDFSQDRGWFINLALGERQNVASQLVLGTLIVPTTIPESSACRPGGKGWLNFFDYRTGRAVAGTTLVSTSTNAPIVGINVIYIPDPANPGKNKPVVSAVTADNPTPEVIPGVKFSGAGSGFQKKRMMWREVVKP